MVPPAATPAEDEGDLCDLFTKAASPPTAEQLANLLRGRFLSDIPYTSIGYSSLVAINPYKQVQANIDSALYEYTAEGWDLPVPGQPRSEALPPHVWQLAARAFYYARRTGQDQAIVFTGTSGSGKSECRRLAIRSLVELAAPAPGKKGSKVVQQIPAAEYILEAFGHAQTGTGSNSSCFGRYSEVQYGDKHRIVGLKGLEYFLDVSRLCSPPKGERNFHVLHQLVAGATREEAEHLHLDAAAASGFRYLASVTAEAGDGQKFAKLKLAFKSASFPKRAVASICQVLAAILHLGQLEFHNDKTRNADAALVTNREQLAWTGELLGVGPDDFEAALHVKTKTNGWDRVTAFLDPEGCKANADDLSRNLYSLLFAWLNEYLNSKLSREDFKTFVALVDFPGPQRSTSAADHGLEAFAFNLASERAHAFVLEHVFERNKTEYETEDVARALPGLAASYFGNAECVRILTSVPGGLVHIIDDQSRRRAKTDSTMLEALGRRWGNHSSFGWRAGDDRTGRVGTFTVNHWEGQVTYSTDGMLERNRAAMVSTDFVALFAGSTNPFLQQLFAREAESAATAGAKDDGGLKPSSTLKRGPSTKRRKAVEAVEDAVVADGKAKAKGDVKTLLDPFNDSLTELFDALQENRVWQVYCLRPNNTALPNQVDLKLLRHQMGSIGIAELARRLDGEWSIGLNYKELWDRVSKGQHLQEHLSRLAGAIWSDKLEGLRIAMGFTDRDFAIGKTKVFLSDSAFRQIEDYVRALDETEQKVAKDRAKQEIEAQAGLMPADTYSPFAISFTEETNLVGGDAYGSTSALPLTANAGFAGSPYAESDTKSFFDDGASRFEGAPSLYGSEAYAPQSNMFRGGEKDHFALAEKGELDAPKMPAQTVEVVRVTAARKWWVAMTWAATFWIPGFMLGGLGRLKRPDVRMAWREKLLINMLIWLLCGIAIFIIAILGDVICPRQHVYANSELSAASFANDPNNELIAIRGEVFDLSGFAPKHAPAIVSTRNILKYGGEDASALFPVQVSALCQGVSGSISPWITLDTKNKTEPNAIYHDFRAATSVTDFRPDWYMETMIYLRSNYRKGFVGYTTGDVQKMSTTADSRNVAIYRDFVYDMTGYIQNGGGQASSPPGTSTPIVAPTDRAFMDPAVTTIFASNGGADVTSLIDGLNLNPAQLQAQRTCLRNLFLVGRVDTRNSPQCQFSRYILLAMSILIVCIIGFKFLAALNFARSRQAEDYDKFVICQVPCYTEGEDSLRKCLQSLAALKYDDKRKLIFVIADGNIIGAGNDRSTPRIVLDILGCDPAFDPEPLSFQSLGDGARQHNMGKVYSGLFEHAGHIVPYIVLVKVGKPTERSRPGNRGKRDSQLILMRFLNRIFSDAPMSPCELEMYHQIKNVIGVVPTFYEYLLSIDADTVVDPEALQRLIGTMMRDRKVIGLCGETSLSNARHSMITMMQVYEYFISHHLAKAFESLFGSVTCLPGCFTLFRIRTFEAKPLFCSDSVVEAFGVNRVDTLHLKNLLHLGEDRYLTTLLLKNFPTYKTSFCRDVMAQTIAPDEWKILLSQRRRWINSTIHNLFELLWVDRLCGFCCFSMRFVVFIDLMSTLIQPVTVAYIVYLIYLISAKGQTIPTTSLIMIAAIYGLQMFIFIVHGAFEMIGWMIVYILAIPVFSLFLPLYSFWKQDDFSWGSTRVVLGEKGKRLVIHDEGQYDPSEIPLKRWQDYEEELWERGSNQSIGSIIAHGKRQTTNPEGSIYGRASQYDLATYAPYANSRAPSVAFGSPQRRSSAFVGGFDPAMQQQYFDAPPSRRQSGMAGAPLQSYDANLAMMAQPPLVDAPLGYLPSDEQISADVIAIVSVSDLSQVSKKVIRQELERRYGVPLGEKLAFANSEIERAAMSAF